MNIRRSILLAAATLILVTVALTSCSKDSGPTAPGGGGLLNSDQIPAGSGFQFVFPTAGSFAYHCANHAVMRGTIHVTAGGFDTLRVNIANSTSTGFQAQGMIVRPGGRVIWSNLDSANHTVTSD